MDGDWQARETSTHQDHVIAHVLGAAALGYLVLDEALYILLDIGFVWMIFVDCEMGLLPHPVAVNELEIAEPLRDQIKAEIDLLLSDSVSQDGLRQLIQTPVGCQIKDVNFFEQGDRRRLIIEGESASLAIETSLTTAEIQVMDSEHEKDETAEKSSELGKIAETEHKYLHQRLREELGREPTEDELDEWLRQHTEGY